MSQSAFAWHPLTLDRWQDLISLFGQNGACGGCWCMFWRLSRKEFVAGKGAVNEANFQTIIQVASPGILIYHDANPIGWCAVAPREEYPFLARSRIMAPVDDKPVWSVSCFFVRKDWRKKGIGVRLLKAAVEFARDKGAHVLEGYPTESGKQAADPFVWTGLASMFKKEGFKEVARRSSTRPIFRKNLCG